MKRIDSHQHFWNYSPNRQVWMNEDMAVLKRDFSPHDLEPLLKRCNLDGCVAIQASQSEEENDFLLGLAANSTFIKGIVGWVDLQSENIKERLSFYKQFTIMKGFRHVIHDETDINFMLRPAFLNGIKELSDFNFTYDILIYHYHLANTLALIKKFPEQPFVIDHIAKPEIRNRQMEDWKMQLSAIAAYPNVYCKISGLTTEATWHKWQYEDFKPYLTVVTELFGTDRIMYGSDWPVCTLSSSYEKMYEIAERYFSGFTKNEQDKFFGLNAIQFYNL